MLFNSVFFKFGSRNNDIYPSLCFVCNLQIHQYEIQWTDKDGKYTGTPNSIYKTQLGVVAHSDGTSPCVFDVIITSTTPSLSTRCFPLSNSMHSKLTKNRRCNLPFNRRRNLRRLNPPRHRTGIPRHRSPLEGMRFLQIHGTCLQSNEILWIQSG